MSKNKHSLIFLIIIIFLVSGSYVTAGGSAAAAAEVGEVLGHSPDWAELRVSNGVFVRSINGEGANWRPGFVSFVPAGRVMIEARMDSLSGTANFVTLTTEFLPGNSYMIEYLSEGVTTETRGNYRITTYEGNIAIREYGASSFTVPGRNESIVEFTLDGSFTRLYVNGYHYKLSSHREDAASRLILVLPPGRHQISSMASVGTIELNLPPNRYISYSVSTNTASISQTRDSPLAYLGSWKYDVDWNAHLIITFSLEGKGFLEMYENNVLLDNSGLFTYTATDSNITITSETPRITMRYRLTQDSNRINLENFWGSPMDITGTRY